MSRIKRTVIGFMCDRCGKLADVDEEIQYGDEVEVLPEGWGIVDQRDLCEDCLNGYWEWFDRNRTDTK
jgi:hypothetical protein